MSASGVLLSVSSRQVHSVHLHGLHCCTAVARQRGNKRKREADGAGGGAPAAHARFQDQRAPWAHGSGIRCGGALLRPPGPTACSAAHPTAAYEEAVVRFS